MLTREAFSYAVLIIVLFGIATLAVREALDYITGLVPAADVAAVTAVFVSLTLGFMLVAGAFGVWTIHASGTAESRRRIAELVNSMDYIHDGVLAVDKKGRIRGANPAAQKLASEFENGTSLLRAFPGLSPEDQDLLLASDEPVEIERAQPCQNTLRELRFRSQPSAGVTLILASDISATNAERQRRRQVARLQLIGHLARGVANDFNSILCTISGHAALLSRLPPSAPQV
ncbi:MAG: hypothetical protein N2255_05725, partial [Kiritimatiellae bacterium]|nr:hypothetical protein [Kiritimatiellia bacterium]